MLLYKKLLLMTFSTTYVFKNMFGVVFSVTHVLHRSVANEHSWLTNIFSDSLTMTDLPCMIDMHLSWRITWHHRKD